MLDTEEEGGIAPPRLLLLKTARLSSDGTEALAARVRVVRGDNPPTLNV
jgi:hypothetical protein